MQDIETTIDFNRIHPTAVVEPSVRIGRGNTIGPYAVITGDVEIGDGNWIGAHVTIGAPAQFSTEKFELNGSGCSGVTIGSRNVIREYCTVHQPSRDRTIIEDDCYLMAYTHVSHDTQLCSRCVLANNVQIGGFSYVGEGANVGLSAVLHQFSTIGAYAMVGMGTILSKDAPPFAKVYGAPPKIAGVNHVGMQRNGFSEDDVRAASALLSGDRVSGGEACARHFDAFESRGKLTGRKALEWR